MILIAKKQDKLYFLQHNTKMSLSHQATSKTWAVSQIWLHYKCLGQPPFEFVDSSKCEVCDVSKHHHASFYPSNSKSVASFDLVHSDSIKKRIQSYNDTKCVNLEFSKFVTNPGIVHELTYFNTLNKMGLQCERIAT
ncbi:hypothetical protein CR513_12802, partial [Mucuna pruriens]